MAIYHLVRQTFAGFGTGIIVKGGEALAVQSAKTCAEKFRREYSVFKCTEQRLGSYRPKDGT